MTQLVMHTPVSQAIALPAPRIGGAIAVREATLHDVPFIDALQRKHARMVGWFPTKQIEGNIAKGKVLIAEEIHHGNHGTRGNENDSNDAAARSARSAVNAAAPVGYCIAHDKYLKREELGIVYQLNVVPDKHRGLIGATLLKAVFERSAYGCKLFCCWCAQDLQANHFWESMGFIPLAFRTGSRTAGSKKTPRIHIFWQRRIRENDTETPYWFPSETSGGAIGEARLVLPIPPGTHWSDAKPAILPGMENVNVLPPGAQDESVKKLRVKKEAATTVKPASKPAGGLWFAPPPPTREEIAAQKAAAKAQKPKPPRERFKHDPKMVAAARELRDRYMEQVNLDPSAMLPPSAHGKYEVSRQLEAAPTAMKVAPVMSNVGGLLEAA